ncbi:probable ATP-dependent DNA helicase HFM1 isoform X2 [Octopus sinensis]|uniref:DNA 3'-5' helicase n=1 Tax=Octopus sinensis TaxID=2607531 RepID=A0A7E6FT46_9MOLL|nr:probable ATP-dependent DNA helicase HFM1 isoform X2 [Octopus sinensis]
MDIFKFRSERCEFSTKDAEKQSTIPVAPSIDDLFKLDSVNNEDFNFKISQMSLPSLSQVKNTQVKKPQFKKSQVKTPKTTQAKNSQSYQPKKPRDVASKKDEIQFRTIPRRKIFVNPFKSQKEEEDIGGLFHDKTESLLSTQDYNTTGDTNAATTFTDDATIVIDDNDDDDGGREGGGDGRGGGGGALDIFKDVSLELSQKDSMFEQEVPTSSVPLPKSNMLKSVKEIPSKFRDIFPFEYFNSTQSKIIDDVLYTDSSIVVCAPTGAGKTVVFELAIVRVIIKAEEMNNYNFKAVYMAPIKALCTERYEDWEKKLGKLGIRCLELTGDTDADDFSALQTANIIITTPEKWDSVTRRWHCDNTLAQHLKLFMIDEIHTLNDPGRGSTIEAVISRMKTIHVASKWMEKDFSEKKNNIRFLAVSATIQNLNDLAEWLGDSDDPAVTFKISDDLRPVKLQKIVIGYPCSERISNYQFDISLRYKLPNVILNYSDGKPTLVFCSTRKNVIQTADMLSKQGKFLSSFEMRTILSNSAKLLKDAKLHDFLLSGVGCHHAGMDYHDRKLMADLFEAGNLLVLLATSTLAMGVNLPAHLVVVMSTQYYVMGNHQEYSESQVLQMIGRAGRPQFDTSATAVILTKMSNKSKYENLVNGMQVIESSLHKNLIEHLNAEIFLNTITDINVAVEWIKHTFLYIRVRKNPKHYGISDKMTNAQMEKYLQDLCLQNLNHLASVTLIVLDEDTFDIKPTDMGRLMARYCIAFDTMKSFAKLTGSEGLSEQLDILSRSYEFSDIQIRTNEKKTLNSLNKSKTSATIRYPFSGKIKTKESKINCLIQAALGCILVPDFSLLQDINKIFRSGQRLTRCLQEILWLKDCHKSLINAIYINKCFKARIWENSKYVTKQLEGIGQSLSNALVNAGIVNFDKVSETNPRELELITNRHPPFGNQLKEAVMGLPKYNIAIKQVQPVTTNPRKRCTEIEIMIAMKNKEDIVKNGTTSPQHTSALIVANADNHILYRRKIMDRILLEENGFVKKVPVRNSMKGPEIFVNLISFDWVGIDVSRSFTPIYHDYSCQPEVALRLPASSLPNKVCHQPDTKPRQAPSKDNTKCQHRCLNKKECSHQCCKVGVKKPQRSGVTRNPRRMQVNGGGGGGIGQVSGMGQSQNYQEQQQKQQQTPVVKGQSSMYQYMDDLKEKLKGFKQTPIKRLKPSDEKHSVLSLQQFAFSSKAKLPALTPNRTDPSYTDIPDPVTEPHYNMESEPCRNNWQQLEMYKSTREKFLNCQDENIHSAANEETRNDFHYGRDINNTEELCGNFLLELSPLLPECDSGCKQQLVVGGIHFSQNTLDSLPLMTYSPYPSDNSVSDEELADLHLPVSSQPLLQPSLRLSPQLPHTNQTDPGVDPDLESGSEADPVNRGLFLSKEDNYSQEYPPLSLHCQPPQQQQKRLQQWWNTSEQEEPAVCVQENKSFSCNYQDQLQRQKRCDIPKLKGTTVCIQKYKSSGHNYQQQQQKQQQQWQWWNTLGQEEQTAHVRMNKSLEFPHQDLCDIYSKEVSQDRMMETECKRGEARYNIKHQWINSLTPDSSNRHWSHPEENQKALYSIFDGIF